MLPRPRPPRDESRPRSSRPPCRSAPPPLGTPCSREEILDLVPPIVHLPVVLSGIRPAPPPRAPRVPRTATPRRTPRPRSKLRNRDRREGPAPRKAARRAGKDREADQASERVVDALEDARKRLDTLFWLPKRSGRSRQGDPARNRRSAASGNSRLSAAVAPGSVALPGSMCSVRARMASASAVLSAFICHPALSACAAVAAVVAAKPAWIRVNRNPIVNRP